MPFASELGERLAAKREDFLKAAANEKPTKADVDLADQLHQELQVIEAEHKRASQLEVAAAERKAAAEAEAEAKERGERAVMGAPLPSPSYKGANLALERASMGKTMAALVAESPEYRNRSKTNGLFDVTVPRSVCQKAAGDPILSTSFGYRYSDTGIPTHLVTQPQVMDLLMVVPVTGASSVRYFRTVSPVVGGAAPVTEGTLKPEYQPRWAPVDAPLEVIATWTAVTFQALDDVPQLRAIIDQDLRNEVVDEVDNQILNGTGTPPSLTGILTMAGLPTQAFTTDALTTISAAITKIVSSGAGSPTGIVINPADWQAIRLLNSNGIYWFGPPTDQGTMRLWGVPVVVSTHMPAGFALVGNYTYAKLFERWGVRFVTGYKNDDLIKNQLTIVCEVRVAVAVTRLAGFVNADIVTP